MKKKIVDTVNDLLISIQFLSRLPVPETWVDHQKPDFKKTSWIFPLAGLVIALPATVTLIFSVLIGLPTLIVAALTLCVHVLTCGALHEDGLADCADGFGGGATKDKKLTIMKDSLLGTYGVLAIVVSFILRFSIIASLLALSPFAAVVGFLASQSISRSVQVAFWRALPPARADGLSGTFSQPSYKALRWALSLGFVLTLFLCSLAFSAGPTLIALSLSIGVAIAFRTLCLRQIGGQTGDTLGAIQIISEIAFLIGLTTFLF